MVLPSLNLKVPCHVTSNEILEITNIDYKEVNTYTSLKDYLRDLNLQHYQTDPRRA